MSTNPTPTAETPSTDKPKQTIAGEYLEAQRAHKIERRDLWFWLGFLIFVILAFGLRVFLHTATQLTGGEPTLSMIGWSLWSLLTLSMGIWLYSKALMDYTRSVDRLARAEAAALKEVAKSEADT